MCVCVCICIYVYIYKYKCISVCAYLYLEQTKKYVVCTMEVSYYRTIRPRNYHGQISGLRARTSGKSCAVKAGTEGGDGAPTDSSPPM